MTDKTLTDELAAVIAQALKDAAYTGPEILFKIGKISAQAIADRLEQVGWAVETHDIAATARRFHVATGPSPDAEPVYRLRREVDDG